MFYSFYIRSIRILKCIPILAIALLLLTSGLAQARELTFGTQFNEASNAYQGLKTFASELEQLSAGKLKVKIFASSTLGDFKAMVAQVQEGELDMVTTGYPDMSYIIPELKLVGAPYVVDDFAHLQDIVAGPWGQKMAKQMAKNGVQILDTWYQGTRQTTSNKPIRSLKDMKGLRLRTPNVPFLIAYAENTGATPAPVAFAEVYLALQTNQVDAEENPLPTIEAMKFYEVQSHVAMTNHFIASIAVQIGTKTWKSLSDQEKSWVKAAVRLGGDASDALTFKDEANLIATFQDRGLTITYPDNAPFRAAMKPYYDELEKEFGKGSIAMVRGR